MSTTTVTTLPSTTESVTTEAPTTTEDPRIAEIEAAVASYRQVFVSVLTDPTTPVEELEAVAGGDLLETVVANVLRERATGDTTQGAFVVEPLTTTFESESIASHLSCGLDALAGFDAAGDEVVAADEVAVLRRYELRWDSSTSRWLVVGVEFEGSERTPCDQVS